MGFKVISATALLALVGAFAAGYQVGYNNRLTEECDITQADLHYLKPTSEHFSNLAEEVDWLKEANSFKRKVADLALDNCEMVENLILDGFDSEFEYTGADIEEALEYHGFYQNMEKIDSLLNTQL